MPYLLLYPLAYGPFRMLMVRFCCAVLLVAALVAARDAHAEDAQLSVVCRGDDIGAEVYIDDLFRGGCPMKVTVPQGELKLRVVMKLDVNTERVYERKILIGKAEKKQVVAVLVKKTSVAGNKVEVVRRESSRLEVLRHAALAAELAMLSNQGVQPGNGKSFRDCPGCPELVLIPAGSFEMGSNEDDAIEAPQHPVTINYVFALGKTEVTQGQWRAVMDTKPSYFSDCGDDCPVEGVSWNRAQEFIQKLNAKTGKHYRLPSEAEWEYACRAGTRQKFCGSDDLASVAWYGAYADPPGNSGESIHAVATKQANAFGLHDMSGNVWEWLEDSYHDSYKDAPNDGSAWQGDGHLRMLRGGSWFFNPEYARAVFRTGVEPELLDNNLGFRVVRTLP